MSFLQALIYGLVQGLSEFLPISSSAHLLFLEKNFLLTTHHATWELFAHLATLVAVVFFLRKKIKKLTKKEFFFLGVATASTVLLYLLFSPWVKNYRENENLIIFNLLFFALLLGSAQRCVAKNQKKINLLMAAFLGVAQFLALFPGVSRSGITLTCALWLGAHKDEAAEFSFLMAIPIILGGSLLHAPEIVSLGENFTSMMGVFLAALVSGLVALYFFFHLFKKTRLYYFVGYRFLFAGIFYLIT